MFSITPARLEKLRNRLGVRGQRPSVLQPSLHTSQQLIEAMDLVQDWSAFCEAVYLVLIADHRLANAEVDVLRGALYILSHHKVRAIHTDAMLDAAARKLAQDGIEKRLQKVIAVLKEDCERAETAVLLAIAIVSKEGSPVGTKELMILDTLQKGLNIREERIAELFTELESDLGDTLS